MIAIIDSDIIAKDDITVGFLGIGVKGAPGGSSTYF